jgi:hypothetical protein
MDKAAQVKKLIVDTLNLAEDGWKAARDAEARADELQAHNIRLEKVAKSAQAAPPAATPALDDETVDWTVNLLDTVPGLEVKDRVKLAALLRKDPLNTVLDLLEKVATFSSPSRLEGRGVSKSAAGQPDGDIAGYKNGKPVRRDPDGFHEVILGTPA